MATRFRTRLLMLLLLGVIGYPTLCHHLSTETRFYYLVGRVRPSNTAGRLLAPQLPLAEQLGLDSQNASELLRSYFGLLLPWTENGVEPRSGFEDFSPRAKRWGLPVPWLQTQYDDVGKHQSPYTRAGQYHFLFNPFPPLIVLGLAVGGPYLLARRQNADAPEPQYVPVVRCLFAGAAGGFVSGWGYVLSSAMLFGSPILTVPFDRWQPAAFQAAGYLFGAAVGPYLFHMLVPRSPEPA